MAPMSRRRKVLKTGRLIKKSKRLVEHRDAATRVAVALKEAEMEMEKAVALKEADMEKAVALKEADMEKAVALKEMEKEMEKAMALKEAEAKFQLKVEIDAVKNKMQMEIDITKLKYINVSSRFWLEMVFQDFATYARSQNLQRAAKLWNSSGRPIMSRVNAYLVSNPSRWQAFLRHKKLQTLQQFPTIPEMLLYGAASSGLHQPLGGLVIVDLSGHTGWPDYAQLFHDVGEFYAKQNGYAVERLDLTKAHVAMMRQPI